MKGLQLDPLKKRKAKACYSKAGKKFAGKKFQVQELLNSDTEEVTEENLTIDKNKNDIVVEDSDEMEIFFKSLADKPALVSSVREVADDILPCPKEIRMSRQKISLFALLPLAPGF